MSTQVILLERVEKLGQMGDVVSVKPGYARNYLLPEKKALRASKDNIAYFEAQKKHLEAANEKGKTDAQATAEKLEGLKIPLIRQASEAGQLFGSVTSRDIAEEITKASKVEVARSQVQLNQNYKILGLFDIEVILHPEVKVVVTVNIARSPEEAEIQAETGRALVADAAQDAADEAAAQDSADAEEASAAEDAQLAEVLEEGALEAEKEKQAAAEEKAAQDAAKAEEKAAEKAEKEAAKAAAEEEAAAEETAEADEDVSK